MTETTPESEALSRERDQLLARLQVWLETPMLVLAFIWLALFVVEMLWGLSPLLEAAGWVIWVVFAIEFALGFMLAPRKRDYLQRNWLKAIALLAPALRILRVFRVLRLARLSRLSRVAGVSRSARLLRVVSSLNRGMRALGASMGRRGMGYVLVLTMLVTVVGAAGMYAFENEAGRSPGFDHYGDALWWTAMLMTTMGSSYWPDSAAGRILCLLLSLYAFGVFGYVTATLASFFVGRDAEDDTAEIAGERSIAGLHEEIAALRRELVAQRRPGEG
ncbi:ion transporter [Lysobacter sp. D1-1-M9]|uniref:ion transporter n=1 Tax=Novilysobacter longmucuonensis TaxID=3098603 RepID=UPI002FC654CC